MTKRMPIGTAVIFCLTLKNHPVQPADISKAEPVACPECQQQMWLSEKKATFKKICEQMHKPVLFCCSDCFMDKAKTGYFNDLSEITQVNI